MTLIFSIKSRKSMPITSNLQKKNSKIKIPINSPKPTKYNFKVTHQNPFKTFVIFYNIHENQEEIKYRSEIIIYTKKCPLKKKKRESVIDISKIYNLTIYKYALIILTSYIYIFIIIPDSHQNSLIYKYNFIVIKSKKIRN